MTPSGPRIRYTDKFGVKRSEYVRRPDGSQGTMSDAIERREELRREHYRPGRAVRSMTVGEIWERDVLPKYRRRVDAGDMTERGLSNLLTAWRRCSVRWSDVQVSDVCAADLESWLAAERVPLSASRRILTVMRAITSRARALKLSDSDPLAGSVELPNGVTRVDSGRTVDDHSAYIAAAAGDRILLAGVILMLCGGCRVGEALAVRADSVEWDGTRATFAVVDEALTNGGLAGRLKNANSARAASVAGKWGLELAGLAREALDGRKTYLCEDADGKPVGVAGFRRAWYKALDAAGLPRETLRSLRPSFATAMLDAGASSRAVNISMGHTPTSPVLATNYDRPSRDSAPVLPDAFGK